MPPRPREQRVSRRLRKVGDLQLRRVQPRLRWPRSRRSAMPFARQCAIIAAFTRPRSMQSATASRWEGSSSATFDSETNAATVFTPQVGLIWAIRSARTSTFGRPTVPASACSCRFVFVRQTSSRSTRISRPTPDLARASTVHDPTPPRPTTATVDAARRAARSTPSRRAIPPNRSASMFEVMATPEWCPRPARYDPTGRRCSRRRRAPGDSRG